MGFLRGVCEINFIKISPKYHLIFTFGGTAWTRAGRPRL
nr:MAG TPA: hypothetical protein [Caudoviricetes sp.]